MSSDKEEIIVPKQTRAKKTIVNLSGPPTRRKPPQKKPRREIAIKPPIPISPKSISAKIDSNIVDNTKSAVKRSTESVTKNKTKHSNFLITFVPNSSVRDDVNPKLYGELKDEIKSFAQYILDPKNMDDVLKAAPGNDDKNWRSKIIKLGEDRVASIEDSKDSNKRLHTHIYYPVEHKTKLQLNLDNIRKIAQIMLEPLGITGPRIDAKVEKSTGIYSARDYTLKMGDGGVVIRG